MKFLQSKEISKKIIIAILLVMSFNFISPTVSEADFGGELFKPIAQLILAIGDLLLGGIQSMFLGDGDIEQEAYRTTVK